MSNMANDTDTGARFPTIVIIEDDLFLLKAYGIKFKKQGWNTVLLADGVKAMGYLGETPPEIVLLDLMIPGPSGFEILEAMRKDERWKNVPVFVLTNLGQEESRERAEALGITEYIVKVNSRIDDVVAKIKKTITP
jgi:DNA-binding response OmpR family regulator